MVSEFVKNATHPATRCGRETQIAPLEATKTA